MKGFYHEIERCSIHDFINKGSTLLKGALMCIGSSTAWHPSWVNTSVAGRCWSIMKLATSKRSLKVLNSCGVRWGIPSIRKFVNKIGLWDSVLWFMIISNYFWFNLKLLRCAREKYIQLIIKLPTDNCRTMQDLRMTYAGVMNEWTMLQGVWRIDGWLTHDFWRTYPGFLDLLCEICGCPLSYEV